jgi:hypothetical protein
MLVTPIFASGCASAVSDSAICDGLAADVAAHAAALAEDGGDRSVTTGARLIRRFDAGCAVISESGVVLYAEQS